MKQRHIQARGFSLIEMMATLLVIAMIAAGITLHAEGPMQSAKMKDALQQIGQFDHMTRMYARQQDKTIWLVVDIQKSILRRIGKDSTETLGDILTLPDGFRITRMLMPESNLDGGSTSIRCSRQGFMQSYAVLLSGPNEREQWILFTGLGGELIKVNNEQELRKIMDVAKTRNDAD